MLAEGATIGSRGIRVSALGFGGAPIGNLYTEVSEATARAAIEEALNRGIRYFDTAPFYGHGLSEKRLGRSLADWPRHRFVISTKVGRLIAPDDSRNEPVNDGFVVRGSDAYFDYSRDGIRRSFEASIRRLGLEYIDILLLHDVGRQTHGARHPEVLRQVLDEALPAMMALRDQGAVGAVGLGVNEGAVCLEVLEHIDLDCIMLAGRYTLLEQQRSSALMTEARNRAIAILIAAPYSSGLLGSADRPGITYDYGPVDAQILERANQIYNLCAAEHTDVGAAALQFPLAHPAVASVVAGLRNVEEVRTAVERLSAPVPPGLWERLKVNGIIDVDAPVPV